MKRYINWALLYTIFAMVGGVFYREFTKFNGFTGKTTLAVVHTHYFVLGMAFFLLMLLLEKNFSCVYIMRNEFEVPRKYRTEPIENYRGYYGRCIDRL